jgi:SAM-dependent methyltransferase
MLPPDFPLPAMRTELAEGDTMYDGRDDHYLAVGLSALACIEKAMAGRSPQAILDLPCGFGRVTRVLRGRYPAARITVCDLDRPGVDFAARQFDARPDYSVDDLGQLRLGETYDLIWVGSLVTHLSEAQSGAFLDSMAACMTPDAILLVSSHGPSIAAGLKEWGYGLEPPAITGLLDSYKSRGYGHRGYGDGDGYGISLTDRAWWERAVASRGLQVLSYDERGWDGHQDVVVLRRLPGLRRIAVRVARRLRADAAGEGVMRARAATAAYDAVLAQFDPVYYLATNPDVARAVEAGDYASAYDHYRRNGRKEGRPICAARSAPHDT